MGAAHAQSDAPLSAIDWLSDTLEVAPPAPDAGPVTDLPVTGEATGSGAGTSTITVTSLDSATPDAAGLLATSETGLPANLWGVSSTEELARALNTEPADLPPSMQRLLRTLLLAELNPPFDAAGESALFLARIDRLLALGLLDEAEALLEIAGTTEKPAFFRRAFDISLLKATENAACETLRDTPELSPTYPARIFCLARGGDWQAAALTLSNAEALNLLEPSEEALMSHFLEDGAYEGLAIPAAPRRPSPLEFRIYEAIGERVPTTTLPVAFARADLFETNGWKTRLEAAERLARTGALDADTLFTLYQERQPAASGGVWDRAEAVQAFIAALEDRDPDALGQTLPPVWAAMSEARLGPVFAEKYGPALSEIPIDDAVRPLAFEIALMSPAYESAANAYVPQRSEDRFLIAVARGIPQFATASTETALAIRNGFAQTRFPQRYAGLVATDRLGEALFLAIRDFSDGAAGDLDQLRDALAFFRLIGLEDVARRAALDVLLQEAGV
ncbi:MAG: hypothetical protein HRU32_00280 [Rhodobacteraceae bacterium]|nr:hypothetical protein [Paracoccaceae bacterium]